MIDIASVNTFIILLALALIVVSIGLGFKKSKSYLLIALLLICIAVVTSKIVISSNNQDVSVNYYDLVGTNNHYIIEDGDYISVYYESETGDFKKLRLNRSKDKNYTIVYGADSAQLKDIVTKHYRSCLYYNEHTYYINIPNI